MYLKQIDLIGFKSFADKTTITPQQGISCIVGPNGSGKSNIADAVRWVLGEQSARNLRGGSISDVIFSGSKGRKPLGMAEVTLTLDNADGHMSLPHAEITVTRRNFRSGQSEYLINNQPCRLKDIHSLFMDSGVGLDGISIISQGQISELISAKPDERRVLIEEAAGIIKFRNRKKEALRKLEDTERNLERLRDIIGELSSRLGPLEQEAADARQYLELKEKADYYEVNLSGLFLKELHDKLQNINEQLQGMDENVLSSNTQRLQLEARAAELQEQIALIDEAVNDMQRAYYELANKKEQLIGGKQVTDTQIQHINEAKQSLQDENAQLAAQCEALRGELAEARLEATKDAEALESFRSELEAQSGGEKDAKQHLAFLEQSLEQKKNDAFSLATAISDIRNKLFYKEQIKGNFDAKLARLNQQKEQFAEFTVQNRSKLTELQKSKEQLQKQREHLKEKKGELEAKQIVTARQLSSVAAQETAARFDCNSLETRYNTMKEMQENLDGFYPGVKAVLQAAKRGEKDMGGVMNVFAELITVPKEYNTAIEGCLGNALQDIVCRDDAAAKAAIAYLKRSNAGRATFLPLNTLKPNPADIDAVRDMKGVLGRADKLIDYPSEIAKAAEFLLGRTVVTDNIETATLAAKKLGFRYSLITLDGDMVNPGGSMSGGSKSRKTNDILGRRADLDELAQKLAAAQKQMKQWQEKLASLRAENDKITAQMDEIAAQMSELNEQLSTLQREEQSLADAEKIGAKQLAEAQAEIEQALQEVSDIDTEKNELNEQLTELTAREQTLNAELAALRENFEQKQAEQSSSHEDLAQYRIELARRQEMLAAAQKDIERREGDLSDMLWEIETKEKQQQKLDMELQNLQEQLQNSADAVLDIERELAERENALAEKRHEAAAQNEALRAVEAEAKQLSSQLDDKQKELYALQIKKARMEADWENEEEKLRENFQMDFVALCELPPCDLSKKELRDKLGFHKRELARLGNVNLNAIEEFKEVSERHGFLTTQENDLREAKATLNQVIAEMDGIMTGRFREAYQALSREFNNSFNRLFKGGSAALVLTEPDNMLETGVELEVHLPGKKVNNYNLLSGGEKSLIGLALMFASLAVRPTPFCIMDEVDAALDEANVERFAAYLGNLSEQTQFIMISHRQGTMEAAGCLWGVTMQDSGVSKLISVRLEDALQ